MTRSSLSPNQSGSLSPEQTRTPLRAWHFSSRSPRRTQLARFLLRRRGSKFWWCEPARFGTFRSVGRHRVRTRRVGAARHFDVSVPAIRRGFGAMRLTQLARRARGRTRSRSGAHSAGPIARRDGSTTMPNREVRGWISIAPSPISRLATSARVGVIWAALDLVTPTTDSDSGSDRRCRRARVVREAPERRTNRQTSRTRGSCDGSRSAR